MATAVQRTWSIHTSAMEILSVVSGDQRQLLLPVDDN
jgi:hypothetical protein